MALIRDTPRLSLPGVSKQHSTAGPYIVVYPHHAMDPKAHSHLQHIPNIRRLISMFSYTFPAFFKVFSGMTMELLHATF